MTMLIHRDLEIEHIEKAKKDIRFFEPLYDAYYETVFRFIYQRVFDKNTAFDITADVFCKAMNKILLYQDKGFAFSSWLYRIALNEISNHYRDANRLRSVNIDSADIGNVFEELSSDYTEETYKLLQEALGELKENELQMIEMRFFEKRSFKEIAEVFDLSDVNAKIKTYRLLEKLKGIMKKAIQNV